MASRVRLSGAARRPRPQARQSRVSDHFPYEQQLLVSSLMINRKVIFFFVLGEGFFYIISVEYLKNIRMFVK